MIIPKLLPNELTTTEDDKSICYYYAIQSEYKYVSSIEKMLKLVEFQENTEILYDYMVETEILDKSFYSIGKLMIYKNTNVTTDFIIDSSHTGYECVIWFKAIK